MINGVQSSVCNLSPRGQAGDSCVLSLTIDGDLLPETGIFSGPVMCQSTYQGTPNVNQCYQPTLTASLKIQKGCTADTLTDAPAGLFCGVNNIRKQVTSYLGIKYANAPRWQAPQSFVYDKSQIFPATKLSPVCPQSADNYGLGMSEDCLFLNLWLPSGSNLKAANLPVRVFIHGGAFNFGSGNLPLYDGTNLVNAYHEIIVTFNYRLGPFGALAPPPPAITSGNFGILDQKQAIKWVYDNIASFGGDRNKITIVGQSAGAMSVGIMLQQDDLKDKIHQGIMESNPYGIPYKTYNQASDIATRFHKLCPAPCSMNDALAAATKVTITTLPSLLNGFNEILTWAPYLDSITLKGEPLLQTIDKPVVIGTNRNEGILFAAPVQPILTTTLYELYLTAVFGIKDRNTILGFSRYSPNSQSTFDALSNFLTDYLFACPSRLALKNSVSSQTFGYKNSYVASYNNFPAHPECAPNVCHSDELPFVFQNPIVVNTELPASWTQKDFLNSKIFGAYWSSFIATGMPMHTFFSWPAFPVQQQRLEIVDPNTLFLTSDLESHCDFWDSVGYQKGVL